MTSKESNSIRNAVIATVIGGILLAIIFEAWIPLKDGFLWLWVQVTWLGSFFTENYSVKGWLLFGIILLGLTTVLRFINSLGTADMPVYIQYVEDMIHGVQWRWRWNGNEIDRLWCYCPHCDLELVYDDSSCSIYSREPHKTAFICEHCNHQTITSVPGGDKEYALSAVQREIRRRIRTGEFTPKVNC
jgi:hypothetical protein